jgi:hypothetical protein
VIVVKRLALGYMTQRVSYGGVSEQELSTGSSVMNDFRRDFQNPCSSYSLRQLVSHAGVSASITMTINARVPVLTIILLRPLNWIHRSACEIRCRLHRLIPRRSQARYRVVPCVIRLGGSRHRSVAVHRRPRDIHVQVWEIVERSSGETLA